MRIKINLLLQNTYRTLGKKPSGFYTVCLLIIMLLLPFYSASAAADSIVIRGGTDFGRLRMEAEMWNESLAAQLNPGIFVGADYLIPVVSGVYAGIEGRKNNERDTLHLGAGGEISPLRSSGGGTGEEFHLFNLSGFLQYNFTRFFARTRLGFSWMYPPESQRQENIDVKAGPAVSAGGGFQEGGVEVEFFYALNTSYITDIYLDKTERLDIHRLGFSLGFRF